MGSAVELRTDYPASELRRLARMSKDARQSSRLLSLAAVLDGMNRTDAARIGGMDRQTLRDWVHRFNAAGPEGLVDSGRAAPHRGFHRSSWTSLPKLLRPAPIVPSTAWCAGDALIQGSSGPLRRRLS
jgi:hypothetical protein